MRDIKVSLAVLALLFIMALVTYGLAQLFRESLTGGIVTTVVILVLVSVGLTD